MIPPLPSQAFRHVAVATSDNQGGITFTFPSASPAWTGSVNVLNAPAAAIFTAQVTDEQFGTWSGPSASPTVQAQSQTALAVVGVGLLPGVQYTAQWIAASDDAGLAPIVWPGAALAVPPTATLELASESNQNVVQNNVVTYPKIASGRYDCRGWASVRIQFANAAAGLFAITFTWSDEHRNTTSSTRQLTVAANGNLDMTVPHLGDFLEVDVQAVVANGTYSLTLTQTTVALVAWSTTTDALLITGSATPAGAGNAVIGATSDTFAGWVTLWADCSAFTNWSLRLQWQDTTGTFRNLFTCNQLSNPGGIVKDSLLVIPAPLRLQIVNGDAGAHTATANVIADLYRAA